MVIRRKLLILLLLASLVPLLISTAIERLSFRSLGRELAADSRRYLTTSTRELLQEQVRDFWQNLTREKSFFELAVDSLAREIEHRLTSPPPAGTILLFPADIDKLLEVNAGNNLKSGAFIDTDMAPSGPIRSLGHHLSAVIPGLPEEAALPDLQRLSNMTPLFREIHLRGRDLIARQQVTLESGGYVKYPAHTGTDPAYDPRQHLWYGLARESQGAVWHIPTTAGRGSLITVAKALRPGGVFAGVTAIAIPMDNLYRELLPPDRWSGEAEAKIVAPEEGRLTVLLELGPSDQDHWKLPPEGQFLDSSDRAGLEAIRDEALDGKDGVRRMPFNGIDAVWVYGGSLEGEPFPVIIHPFAEIVAEVDEAEKHVWNRTLASLQVSGLLIIMVVLSAIIMAARRSRTVTEPISLLAEATRRLAGGDFGTQVDIRSGDELEELAQAFNNVGPQLQERERMQRDLEVAKEIQRHLLPEAHPTLKGFDIYGNSLYCDETGGDYFDYIPMAGAKAGGDRLGVVVGDVTGHGIGSALLMTSARGMLRSQAERYGKDLVSLFAELNNHLARDTDDSQFMTLFYGYLDGPGRTLTWLSGGQGPIFLVRGPGREAEELPTSGLPLGLMDDAVYQGSEPLTLAAGDLIVIGTDGIWEATDTDGEMFGLERFCDTLRSHAHQSAEEIYAAVMTEVERFQKGKRQDDDITLMVIKAL